MRSPRARLALLIAFLPFLVVAAAVVYQAGMGALEGEERTFWDAVSWAAETVTTTGYGGDSHWRHPLMVLFVVVLQFVGVFLVFLVFPIFLIPFLEERFETRLPHRVDSKVRDHLVVYGYGPAVESLIDQAEGSGIRTVVVEEDEAAARRLIERGRLVIRARLDDEALEGAGLERARGLIANMTDDANAAVILAARQNGFAGDILALVEEPVHRRPLLLAGATAVFTPRHVLGAELAARASARIQPPVAGVRQVGRLQVHQVRVQPASPIAGKTLAQAGIGRRAGAVAIGQWVGGRLRAPLTAATRLEPGGILVIVGTEESIERLTRLCQGAIALRRQGPFVIGGFGEVGQKVVELLVGAGEEVRVVDREEREGVDVVGDMLDPQLVERLDLAAAQAVILALDTDSATLFATVIAKEAAADVPVIARVNQAQNVERLHRAGADFALSISQVSAQILARRLLGEEAVALDAGLRVAKTEVPEALVGKRVDEADVRERTGCSVVAIERGDEVLVDLGPGVRFAAGDRLYVSGTVDAVRDFGRGLAGA